MEDMKPINVSAAKRTLKVSWSPLDAKSAHKLTNAVMRSADKAQMTVDRTETNANVVDSVNSILHLLAALRKSKDFGRLSDIPAPIAEYCSNLLSATVETDGVKLVRYLEGVDVNENTPRPTGSDVLNLRGDVQDKLSDMWCGSNFTLIDLSLAAEGSSRVLRATFDKGYIYTGTGLTSMESRVIKDLKLQGTGLSEYAFGVTQKYDRRDV